MTLSVGIIGSGALGGAMARAWLRSRAVDPERLWIANRSGRLAGFDQGTRIRCTTRNQDLADACDVVVLAVPPASAADIGIEAKERLVVSVMAGVTIARIENLTGARRIVRAMSSPAAEQGLAFSPWCAGGGLAVADREAVRTLLEACGLSDEVPDEDQIDRFTALTGPVPGFVAYFAACMAAYAENHGVDPAVADRAIRQLFYAGGHALSASPETPAGHVEAMIAYAGTTAAGLERMRDSRLAALIEDGLDAAYDKARRIGSGPA